MLRSVIGLLLVLAAQCLAGCVMRSDLRVGERIESADHASVPGVKGYRWGTSITEIPGLELLGGTHVAVKDSAVTELSGYFRPGEVSPYAGVKIHGIEYIFCHPRDSTTVGLCGAAVMYGSEEYLRRFEGAEPPKETNHQRLMYRLTSDLGIPMVRRVISERRTQAIPPAAIVPFSDSQELRYTWCQPGSNRMFFIFSPLRCDPQVVVDFDPVRGEGYALFLSEGLLKTVEEVQLNSNLEYVFYKRIYGPDWAQRDWTLPSDTHVYTLHLAVKTECSPVLASERARKSKVYSAAALSTHHPISEWEYLQMSDYYPFRLSAARQRYLLGYVNGVNYAYHEGRWLGTDFHDKWMHAADSDDYWIRLEGIGYRDGAQLRSPAPANGWLTPDEFERRWHQPATSECRDH